MCQPCPTTLLLSSHLASPKMALHMHSCSESSEISDTANGNVGVRASLLIINSIFWVQLGYPAFPIAHTCLHSQHTLLQAIDLYSFPTNYYCCCSKAFLCVHIALGWRDTLSLGLNNKISFFIVHQDFTHTFAKPAGWSSHNGIK